MWWKAGKQGKSNAGLNAKAESRVVQRKNQNINWVELVHFLVKVAVLFGGNQHLRSDKEMGKTPLFLSVLHNGYMQKYILYGT